VTREKRWKKLLAGLSVEELAGVYVHGDDLELRGACFQLLQRSPPAMVIAQGRAFAESTDVEERAFGATLLLLGISTRPKGWEVALELLVGLMADLDPEVVARAAMAYGGLHMSSCRELGSRARAQAADPSLIPWPEPLPTTHDPAPLVRLATHPDAGVRMQLGFALMLWADPASVAAVITLSHDDDATVSSTAATMMGWLAWAGGATPAVYARLWEMVADPDDEPRVAALSALLKHRQSAVEPLIVAELEAAEQPHELYSVFVALSERRNFVSRELLARVFKRWRKHLPIGMSLHEWVAGGASDSD
jgi:HEAT repeats